MASFSHEPKSTIYDQENPQNYLKLSNKRTVLFPLDENFSRRQSDAEPGKVMPEMSGKTKTVMTVGAAALLLVLYKGQAIGENLNDMVKSIDDKQAPTQPYKVKLQHQITPDGTMVVEWGGDTPDNRP